MPANAVLFLCVGGIVVWGASRLYEAAFEEGMPIKHLGNSITMMRVCHFWQAPPWGIGSRENNSPKHVNLQTDR